MKSISPTVSSQESMQTDRASAIRTQRYHSIMGYEGNRLCEQSAGLDAGE